MISYSIAEKKGREKKKCEIKYNKVLQKCNRNRKMK